MNKLNEVYIEMIKFNNADPKRIQHFTKVHSYAKLIAECENIDKDTQFILETTALMHDIGIRPSEIKYGKCNGKLQEIEGVEPARKMLNSLNFDENIIERVCYLIAHHHTYTNVDGIDYRILLEADFLVNLYEDNLDEKSVLSVIKNIFRTKTGTELCKTMFIK